MSSSYYASSMSSSSSGSSASSASSGSSASLASSGSSASSSSSSMGPYTLTEVTFGSTVASESWNMKKDDGSGDYSGPHWKNSPPRKYPYLYKAGGKMKIVNAKWSVDSPNSSSVYKVKGTGPTVGGGTIEIPETTLTIGTNELEINNVDVTVAFDASTVKYFSSFEITWEIKVDSGEYEPAGTSQNPIYVCLQGVDATSSKPVPYRTVVHVACATDGATNADQAVTNSWSRLAGPSNLKGWDETAQSWSRDLHYYKPGTTFGQNGFGSAGALLNDTTNSTGQCSTWAYLLYDAIRLNGATANYIRATSVATGHSDAFLVNDWSLTSSSSSSSGTSSSSSSIGTTSSSSSSGTSSSSSSTPHPPWFTGSKTFRFGGANFDMIPVPTGGVYGDFTNMNTIKGQNSGSSAPSEKVFGNHQFLKYTPASGTAVYYDASYGVTYSGELDFQQKGVAGFAQGLGVSLGHYELDVIATPAANQIHFDVYTLGY